MVLMQKPSVIDSPSDGAPEKAPRWDILGTEGCGGGNRVPCCSWMFSGYKSIYRRRRSVRGATRGPRGWGRTQGVGRAPDPRGHLEASQTSIPSLLDCFRSKDNSPEGFVPFGLRLIFLFFEILKQAIKQQYGMGLRLIGQSQKQYKGVKISPITSKIDNIIAWSNQKIIDTLETYHHPQA